MLVYSSLPSLHQDLGQLASAHSKVEKSMTDLANKIEALQLQETKLADQIQNTSDALEKHTVLSTQRSFDCKLNVILYGIDEQCLQPSRLKGNKMTSRLS